MDEPRWPRCQSRMSNWPRREPSNSGSTVLDLTALDPERGTAQDARPRLLRGMRLGGTVALRQLREVRRTPRRTASRPTLMTWTFQPPATSTSKRLPTHHPDVPRPRVPQVAERRTSHEETPSPPTFAATSNTCSARSTSSSTKATSLKPPEHEEQCSSPSPPVPVQNQSRNRETSTGSPVLPPTGGTRPEPVSLRAPERSQESA